MKSIRKIIFATLLIAVGSVNAEAMQVAQLKSHFPDKYRRPLAEWSLVHPFTSQEEMDFYNNETWHNYLTLEQNRIELVKSFVEECCDFSFKMKTIRLKEIDLGYVDSGEHLIFASEDVYICAGKDSTEMTIYNDKCDDNVGLFAPCTAPSFIGYRPVDECMKYKDQFIKYFSKMAEDPVGCKLFRIALTKHVVNNLDKITFIPAVSYEDNGQSNIICNSGGSIYYHLAELENDLAKKRLEQGLQYRFITFDPEFFTKDLFVGVIKYENDDIKFDVVEFFREAALFHEIVHSLHSNVHKKLQESKNIRRRSTTTVFKYTPKNGCDPHYARGDSINVGLFHNDEEYHTIYGITEEGLDLLNESSFSAHTRGFVRASHGDILNADLLIGKTNFGKKKTGEFFQKFFTKHGDHDLFRYYLSPDSPIKYPKFGVGQYKCADLDPNTGEKVLREKVANP